MAQIFSRQRDEVYNATQEEETPVEGNKEVVSVHRLDIAHPRGLLHLTTTLAALLDCCESMYDASLIFKFTIQHW